MESPRSPEGEQRRSPEGEPRKSPEGEQRRSPKGEQRKSPEGEQRGAPSLVPELPANMIGRPVPEIGLPSSEGGIFRLRNHKVGSRPSGVGCGPLVLFFYIRNGTPL